MGIVIVAFGLSYAHIVPCISLSFLGTWSGKGFFGAWVTLNDEDGKTLTFRIVGPDKIYGKKNFASVSAPVARDCIGKSVEDDVVVSTSDGSKDWQILSFDYREQEA